MPRVMNRANVINQLKEGKEIRGAPIHGYSMSGGIYHGWTVRSDTLVLLLRAGLIDKEEDKVSYYNHYRWYRKS